MFCGCRENTLSCCLADRQSSGGRCRAVASKKRPQVTGSKGDPGGSRCRECMTENETTTTEATEECCGSGIREPTRERRSDRWLEASEALDARLPADLQSAFGGFVGRESVETLGEWAAEIRRLAGGGSIAVEQLCHADEGTDHWGSVDGERYHFRCFYDAVLLAAIEDRPVDIHTVSPSGAVVEARAVGSDELSVTPSGAVFSLGIETDAHERSGGEPTLQDGYAAICPYVRAFPDRTAYERWADEVDAPTVAMSLAEATDFAGVLVS